MPATSGTPSPHAVLQLAKSVLGAAAKHSSGKDDSLAALSATFKELTAAIGASHPPLTLPRIPKAHVPTPEQEQRLRRIQKRALVFVPEEKTVLDDEDPSNYYKRPLEQVNRTYGTTPAATIDTLLDVIYPNSRTSTGMFVDAGSGMGLPTLVAALSNRFSSARGIEYERKWHNQAVALQRSYQKEPGDENVEGGTTCQLEYICGDMTLPGYFQGASCIFLNSVTFNADLCQKIGQRLDLETKTMDMAVDGGEEDVFVVSMSRRLPLPSFDLVDVLSLHANEGTFTFYVNRKESRSSSRSSSSFRHYATTDSENMRMLRDDKSSILDTLVDLAAGSESQIGLPFLAAIAVSEPTVRHMTRQNAVWTCLEQSLRESTALSTKALGSMVLRAMVEHPIGRREVSGQQTLVQNLLAVVRREDENPVVRANLLDVLSNLLHDSPLQLISTELGQVLREVQEETNSSEASSVNLLEALTETVAMRRWWEGHERVIPYGAKAS